MIKKCSTSKYLEILGLLSLAEYHNEKLVSIIDAISHVLEVKPKDKEVSGIGNPEHIFDAVYSNEPVEELLKKLGIEAPDKIL